MIIDTLHKESKSQRVITERGGAGGAVQGVLYQSILNAKLTGRKKLGRKMCTSNRDDRKLENTVKQSRFDRELHKEWTEAGVKSHHAQTSSGKELPNHFWNRNTVRSILSGIRRRTTGLLLSGPKSSFQDFFNKSIIHFMKIYKHYLYFLF